MVHSTLIWIPSIQEYKRFKEFTMEHHMIMMKSQENDLDFLYTINKLLEELCVESINLGEITTLDKYVIYLYLRIMYVGSTLSLMITCPECSEKMPTEIDLNNLIENNIDILDKSYCKKIQIGEITTTCSIPSVKNEYDMFKSVKTKDMSDLDSNLSYYILSHIKELNIMGKNIIMSSLSIDDTLTIFENLPSTVFSAVKNEFIVPVSQKITPKILEFPCPTKGCSKLDFTLNLSNINEIIKLIFQGNPYSTIQENFYLARRNRVSHEYLMSISPAERNVILELHMEMIQKENADNKGQVPADNGFNVSDLGFEDFE